MTVSTTKRVAIMTLSIIATELVLFLIDWYVVGEPFTWLASPASRSLSLLLIGAFAWIGGVLGYLYTESR